jgi:hypothetical protein
MIVLIQDNETKEVETLRAEDLSIGIHENWSMVSYTDKNGSYICRTIRHDKYYITCM